MTISRSEDFLIGFIALVLLPLIGWRILRGLRDGAAAALSHLHQPRPTLRQSSMRCWSFMSLSLLLVGVVAADLLFGLGLRDAL